MPKDIESSEPAGLDIECIHLETKADLTLIDEAQQATEVEHSLGAREAFQIYRKGVLCAVIISTTIIMRLYDIVIINSFFALPAFQNHFGEPVPGHGYQIPARWQVALGNASLVGQVIGAFVVSFPMDWIGRKKTLQISLCLQAAIIFMQFFASSIEMLTASEYVAGVILGGYQVLIPTYSAELLPMSVRPYLAAYINICYSIGNLLLAGVSKGFSSWTSQWGYRIPFAIQWAWPAIILPALLFVPESPWYLIAKDRVGDAEKALRRVTSPSPKVDIHRTLALMQKTHLYEQKIEANTTVVQCFKGSSLRRTEIVIMIFFVQDFAGSTLSTTYFFEQLNLTTAQAFDITVGIGAASFICTCLAGFLLRYCGRRSVYTSGIIVVALLNILIGILSLPGNYWSDSSYSWAQVALAIISAMAFQLTIGPFCYTFLTEIPSAKLRAKTVSVAISMDALCGIVTSTVQPYLLSPSEANIGAKANFLWGGLSIISVLWCFFRLPETKNRTIEELDYMFENKVSARQFKAYQIDAEVLRHNLEE